ncbi:MAG: hypothetical protein PVH29_11185 [Candidatus Zixiibacteriota bacterium]
MRPSIAGPVEIDGYIYLYWEGFAPVNKLTRCRLDKGKRSWEIEWAKEVERLDYFDSENLVAGTTYGYVVSDELGSRSDIAFITYGESVIYGDGESVTRRTE